MHSNQRRFNPANNDQASYQGYDQNNANYNQQIPNYNQQYQAPGQTNDANYYNQNLDNAGYSQQYQETNSNYGQPKNAYGQEQVPHSTDAKRNAMTPNQQLANNASSGGSFQYQQQNTQATNQAQQNNQSVHQLEQYNSDKSVLRVTTDRIPNTNALIKETGIPIGVIVKPYGEPITGEGVDSVTYGQKPIIRCKDCRAYINPFVRFIDNGMKWICNFCGDLNPTENYYYSPLTAGGVRQDFEDRAELKKGSVDFIASNEYMNRPPMPPTYLFILDVSKPAIDTGYLHVCVSTIKNVIETQLLPGGERTKVGFITYDSSVHFYNLRSTLKQPQMLVVSEIDQVFLPQPEDLIVNLQDSYELVMNLLENLPSYFQKTQVIDNCFVAALQGANMIANTIGGRLIFFQVSQTIIKHPMLAPKQQQANTGERYDLINSTNIQFANTGQELAHTHISCDLFIFTHGKNQYKNLQTFSDLARKSSGNLYYYPEFNSRTFGLKFSNELYHSLTRRTAWEGVFRIRTSMGFIQTQTYGNIQIKNKTTDLVLTPAIDTDRVIIYELEKNDLLNLDPTKENRRDQSHLYIQSALLYSTSEGERRIRVHNIAIPLTNMKHMPFEYLDVTATSHLISRIALSRLATNVNFQIVRGMIEVIITNLCRSMLKSQQQMSKQLPENMQYLVMYVLGVLKSPYLSPTKQIQPGDYLDSISYLRYIINGMNPEETALMFNPQIISIHNHNLNDQEFPPLEALERSAILTDNIYLCFNGLALYLWVGGQCDLWFVEQIFKVKDYTHIDKLISEEEIFTGYEQSAYLTSLYNIINQFRYQRQPFCEIRVLLEADMESEAILKSMLFTGNHNQTYNMDYAKFLGSITGGGGAIGPGAGAAPMNSVAHAAYY